MQKTNKKVRGAGVECRKSKVESRSQKLKMAGLMIFAVAAAWAPVRRSLGVGGVMPANWAAFFAMSYAASDGQGGGV